MSTVWNKLFGNGPIAANDEAAQGAGPASGAPATTAAEPARTTSGLVGAPPRPTDIRLSTDDSFDAIGQRNETLRNQLDGIAESFRDIENIRGQFEAIISPIARLLRDLEEARSNLEESRQRHASLSIAHDELQREQRATAKDRDALVEQRDSLQIENRQLHHASREVESSLAEAQIAVNDGSLKIANLERSLEGAILRARGLEEANAAMRATLDDREKALTDVEQRRAFLSHQFELAEEEGRALRGQLEEQSHETSKMARLHAEVDAQRNEFARKASELEGQLALESGAHAKLRSTRQDESEAHRIHVGSLSGELSAARARAETAERLLAEARQELRDKLQEMRTSERRALDVEAHAQNQAKKQAELARELAAAKQRLTEVEASRASLIEKSSGLAKAAKAGENALQRADEKIALLETRLAESANAAQLQRAQFEAKLAQLGEQAQSESAARAYAEGALQSARRERLSMQRELVARRGGRLPEGEAWEPAADAQATSDAPQGAESVMVRIAS